MQYDHLLGENVRAKHLQHSVQIILSTPYLSGNATSNTPILQHSSTVGLSPEPPFGDIKA
jgi:hypothetical protein